MLSRCVMSMCAPVMPLLCLLFYFSDYQNRGDEGTALSLNYFSRLWFQL